MDINHNIKSYVKWLAFTVLPFVVLISLQTYAQVSNTPLMEKMIVEPSVSNYKTIVANIFQEDDLFVLFYLNAALVVDPTKDSQVVERISSDNPWESLTQYLYGKSNIYFCPAGHQLSTAIEYMPCPIDPEIMMSDRYGMYRLSSPDELFKNRVGIFRNIHHKAVIFGGLKYDESSGQSSSSLLAFRGHRNLMLGYEYLKSTYDEAVYIDSIFRKNKIESALLIEENGTEAAFKQLSNYDVDILHVASHGFYEPKNDNREATSIQEWMMSHSGLILAGADNEYRGDGSNDGKLTAYEISRTDLTKIKLVVLSACDTGLGDVKENEVYGLLKGFKNAGAGTILLTLNEVSDTVTSLLMKRFYDNIFRGDNPRRALENAQRYIRLHGNGHFNHPKYWASFFLVDDLDRNIGENVSDEIRKSFLQDIVKLEDIYSEDNIFPNWEEIRTQLKPHEAIVRICPYSIGKDSIDYVALIGSHKSKQCQVVRLFSITNNKIGEYMIDLGSYGNLLNIIPFCTPFISSIVVPK